MVRKLQAYRDRSDALLQTFGESIAELYRTNLHDGIVQQVNFDRDRLKLILTVGDLQVGYRDVTVVYRDFSMNAKSMRSLLAAARDRRTEILSDELDAAGKGRLAHRVICWPRGDFTITFAQATVISTPQSTRLFRKIGDPVSWDAE